jgi:hypothetical protein
MYEKSGAMYRSGMNSRKAKISLTAFLIVLIIFGSSSSLAADSKQTLVVGEPWAMGGIDPALKCYNLNNFLVAEGLTAISPDCELPPPEGRSFPFHRQNLHHRYVM